MLKSDSTIEGLANFGTPRDDALVKAGELLRVVGMEGDALQRYPQQDYTCALIDAAPSREWAFQNSRPMHANEINLIAEGLL